MALAAKYVGAYYEYAKDYPGALRHYARARTLDEARLAGQPADRTAQRDVAIDLSNVAGIERYEGHFDQALENYQKSLALRRRLAETDPKDMLARGRVAFIESRIGFLYAEHGDAADGLAHLDESVAIARGMAQLDSAEASLLAEYIEMLAQMQLRFNRRVQGCASFQETQQILTRLADTPLGLRSGLNREGAARVNKALEGCRAK